MKIYNIIALIIFVFSFLVWGCQNADRGIEIFCILKRNTSAILIYKLSSEEIDSFDIDKGIFLLNKNGVGKVIQDCNLTHKYLAVYFNNEFQYNLILINSPAAFSIHTKSKERYIRYNYERGCIYNKNNMIIAEDD